MKRPAHAIVVIGLLLAAVPACSLKAPGALGHLVTTSLGNQDALTITGLVTAPAELIGKVKLISNNGGSIISNNGSSLIGNNGSSLLTPLGAAYRLAATSSDQPVPGLTLVLTDANGHPVLGADGQPIRAVTDATGHFSLAGVPGGANARLVGALGNIGALQAIVVPAAGAAQAVDVNVASTLETSYIVDRFVSGQKNPQATFNRLDPASEAKTRALLQAAIAAGESGLTQLDGPTLDQLVDGLRGQNASLDDELNAVRALLIPGGQSDLGNGQQATSVSLSEIDGAAIGKNGTLYLDCPDDHRLWQLNADGTIQAAIGNDAYDYTSNDGKTGSQASLLHLFGIAPDANGGFWLLEDLSGIGHANSARLSRWAPGGTIQEVASAIPGGHAVASAGDGTALVLSADSSGPPALWRYAPGASPTRVCMLSSLSSTQAQNVVVAGLDAQGRLYLGTRAPDGAEQLLRLSIPSGALETLRQAAPGAQNAFDLDAAGDQFFFDSQGALCVETPGGQTRTLLADAADNLTLNLGGVVLAPDGSAYVADNNMGGFYHVADGQMTLVAGDVSAGGGSSLPYPCGLAQRADGTIVVADDFLNQIVSVDAQKQVTVIAGTGDGTDFGDGGPALQAGINSPYSLHQAADGSIVVLDQYQTGQEALRRIAADGTITSWLHSPANNPITDFDLAPGGTGYVALSSGEVDQVSATGTLSAIYTAPAGSVLNIGSDPRGGLYILQDDATLLHWQSGSPVQTVMSNLSVPQDTAQILPDSQGRVLYTYGDSVFRLDPTSGKQTKLAGPGTAWFAGTSIDQSLRDASFLAFTPQGDLLIADTGHRQIKRIPAAGL
ncbi:MAG TPA: hypothetical protein V6D47_13915 [Oscillatoriaceae cyanobacterium]